MAVSRYTTEQLKKLNSMDLLMEYRSVVKRMSRSRSSDLIKWYKEYEKDIKDIILVRMYEGYEFQKD